mgnify:CR=1 FL=1
MNEVSEFFMNEILPNMPNPTDEEKKQIAMVDWNGNVLYDPSGLLKKTLGELVGDPGDVEALCGETSETI